MNCPNCTAERAATFPTRRALIAGLVCVAVAPATAIAASSSKVSADDEKYMRLALEEARKADFPFGAVIVREGKILARGGNSGRTTDDPTAHGEMVAIRNGVAAHGGQALRGSTLYTTGEPCAMCMGAILWCRMSRLVFAASVDQLATRIDQIMISSAEIAAKTPFVSIEITGGVLADEAMALFPKRK